jgi:O-antigen ligase
MIYLFLASFFYSNVIYRFPIGHYGYILTSDILSWLIIIPFLIKKILGGIESRKSKDRLGLYLVLLNAVMYLSLITVFFSAHWLFSELGRAAADTLRFSQFSLCYYAVKSTAVEPKNNWRYLNFVFILTAGLAIFGLLSDVILGISRIYNGVTKDVLRPSNEFSAFFTDNHGGTSIYLITAISIGYGMLLMKSDILKKSLLIMALGLIIAALIFSKSRAGIAGFGLSMFIFAYLFLKHKGKSLPSIAGILFILFIFMGLIYYSITTESVMDRITIGKEEITRYEYVQHRIKSHEKKVGIMAIKARIKNWEQTVGIIKDMSLNIFFGYGVNQQSYLVHMGGSHNNFFQFIVDLGLIGLILFLLILYEMPKIFSAKGKKQKFPEKYKCINLGMRCGFLGLILTCFSQETFYMRPAMGNFFGFYLIIVAIIKNLNENTSNYMQSTEKNVPQLQ